MTTKHNRLSLNDTNKHSGLSLEQKAAEKWAISQCKKICDWDYVNCYHRANEKQGKHSCDEYVVQKTAFLAGVKWRDKHPKKEAK